MPKTQNGRSVTMTSAILLTAGICAAPARVTCAQDGQVYQGDRQQVVYSADNRAYYAPKYTLGCYGGPYKGFYPCNAKTPYYGGSCYVYGDAPIYSAPADYGHHCAAWCP
jgi:hypothetical protein